MEIVLGFLGALLAQMLLGIGAVIGWTMKTAEVRRTQRVTAEELTQTQKQRLRDEQEAWEALHSYSVEDAYNMHPEDLRVPKE